MVRKIGYRPRMTEVLIVAILPDSRDPLRLLQCAELVQDTRIQESGD
jgi:hypothetical protein